MVWKKVTGPFKNGNCCYQFVRFLGCKSSHLPGGLLPAFQVLCFREGIPPIFFWMGEMEKNRLHTTPTTPKKCDWKTPQAQIIQSLNLPSCHCFYQTFQATFIDLEMSCSSFPASMLAISNLIEQIFISKALSFLPLQTPQQRMKMRMSCLSSHKQ